MRTIITLDGNIFAQMIISGANNLYNNKQAVDDLNVFPVPDGDTGTNMSLTVMAMAKELSEKADESISKTAEIMAFATLRGARGNSGVILSQFFRGISKALKGKKTADSNLFAYALTQGTEAAYKAVMRPTEGTILTVAREVGEGAKRCAQTQEDICIVLENAVECGNRALQKTPDLLPPLKQAGVVDAGGQGWMYVLEGALYYLKNNEIIKNGENVEIIKQNNTNKKTSTPQASITVEDIKFKYCTEFIIEKYTNGSPVEEFKNAISQKGDCMLVIDDDSVVKVHIHTNNPGFVLEEAVKIGEMINLKIDNMKHQHNNIIKTEKKKAKTTPKTKPERKKSVVLKEVGFVAICAGRGLSDILSDLGVDRIIEGGQTMNPSTDDILKAVEKVKAKNVFVFPNNKNILLAANQAKELSSVNIIVIPTKTIPECISAMMAYKQTQTIDVNKKAMNEAIKNVDTAQVTFAVRNTVVNSKEIKKGDILGIMNGEIKITGSDRQSVCEAMIEQMAKDDKEFITVYCGKTTKKAHMDKLLKSLEEKYEDFDVSVKYGGQPIYYYIISVE